MDTSDCQWLIQDIILKHEGSELVEARIGILGFIGQDLEMRDCLLIRLLSFWNQSSWPVSRVEWSCRLLKAP